MNETIAASGNQASHLRCDKVWKVFGPAEKASSTALRGKGTLESLENVVPAVKDVSFQVKAGETLVIMGLSGSGKSTLVRCITRLIEPTAGQVFLNGQCITTMGKSELREFHRHQCAMVFQHFGLFPHKRVLDNVSFGLEIRGVARRARDDRAMEMLELVGLAGKQDLYPDQLSGGMKQRVGLARALAVDPDLLLFDEPFSALDPLIRRDLQDELRRLRNDLQKTMLFITHDMQEALKIGDRIAIMKDGEFVQIGTPEDIVLSPADDYVRRFVSDTPRTHVLRIGGLAQDRQSLNVSSTPAEALASLDLWACNDALAVDENGSVVGAVSVMSLRSASARGESDLRTATSTVPRVDSSDDLEAATKLLAKGSPIVAVFDEDRLRGTVRASDVLAALVGTLAESDPLASEAEGDDERTKTEAIKASLV